jgi:predicted lipoprotein with Yx(FWY)xxD motif
MQRFIDKKFSLLVNKITDLFDDNNIKEMSLSVCVSFNKEIGNYLTDSNGRALYYFKQDRVGTSKTLPFSNCVEDFLCIWQIYYENEIAINSPLKKKDFSVLVRPTGQKQLVYMGHPLYQYKNDSNPGDIKGEGIGNDFFTMKVD